MAELKKRLNLINGVGLAVSTIIGSGLLGLPGLAIDVGGTYGAVAGWIVTSLLSLPMVFLFMRLALIVQNAGGVAYAAELAFGRSVGDVVTVVIAATFSLCIPVGTWMGSAYLQRIFSLPEGSVTIIALVVLIICTLVNILGARPSAFLNSFSIIALVALVFILAFLNPSFVGTGWGILSSFEWINSSVTLQTIWNVSSILFWAYIGWENLSFGSEEIINKPGLIQRVFFLGFLVIVFIYGLLALVSIGANANGRNISGITGLLILTEGSTFSVVIKGLIALVVIANVNAWVFAASRLVFSGGRSGLFFSWLGKVSTHDVPKNSLIFLMFIYSFFLVLLASGYLPITTILAIVNQNFVILYLVAALAFIKLSSGILSVIIAILSILACMFLLSGFGWWMLIPIFLSIAGVFLSSKRSIDVKIAN